MELTKIRIRENDQAIFDRMMPSSETAGSGVRGHAHIPGSGRKTVFQ